MLQTPHSGRAGLGLVALLALGVLLLLASCGYRAEDGPALHRAVLNNDLAAAKAILERDRMAARMTDRDGLTALHFTAVRLRIAPDARLFEPASPGDAAKVQSSPGCWTSASFTSYDIDDLRSRRLSPAEISERTITTVDHGPMAELLVGYGAPLNAKARGRAGMTPLQLAARMGHMDVVNVLLSHGADVGATDSFGQTALHTVAHSGNLAMVRRLLDAGADVNSKVVKGGLLPVFKGDTPLSLAVICSHREVLQLLLERGADANSIGQDGFQPLHLADKPEIAELLMAHGARLEGRGYENRTPLDQAAMQARTELAAFLISKGANVEATDEDGRTPLILAAGQPTTSQDMVALLIRSGAKLDARAKDGETPLLAALSHDRRTVAALLDAGANVNIQDRYGRTPLHWAVEGNDVALVELLLARGADVNILDRTRRAPLYYTWGGSAADHQIAALLRSHGAAER